MSQAPTPADAPVPDESGRLSLRRLAARWPRAIVTAWAIAVVVLLARIIGDPGVEISGRTDVLVPTEHRAPDDEPLLLLTVDQSALDPEQGASDLLQNAGSLVAAQLGARRVPLGPPSAELTAWIDAHALYLLPVEAHDALAQRLSDTAMSEAVDALQARLSSPLYGVSGEQPRRDPLRLQQLAQSHAGRMTHLGNADDMPAELTAAGDLLALDGQALLVQLRTTDEPDALQQEIDEALTGLPVHAELVGPAPRRARARADIERSASSLLSVGLAGLVLVLSLALRAVRPVLAIVAVLLSALLAMLVIGPAVDLYGVALLVLLLGFGCEGAMHLSRISPRGWPAAAVLGAALVPLWWSPYPAWQQWAVGWLAGMAVIIGLLRVVMPAGLALLRFQPSAARRSLHLRPLRPLALLLTVAALGSGGWAISRLAFVGLDRTPRPIAQEQADKQVREAFFDPRLVVRARSEGDTPAAALERSAEHARQLATLVPDDARRVDSPGRLVLPPAELQSRQRSLQAMELDARMNALRQLLETRGFRPDAFGEFLRGAANLEDLPTPQAALDGPLGDWIRGYLTTDEGRAVLVSRVHLDPDDEGPVPALQIDDQEPLRLFGPAVAARTDRLTFDDWLGLYVAGQLWLGALVVWLALRRLGAALGCIVAGLSAQTAVLAVMLPLGVPLGPAVLPALLLVGAAAIVASARACRAVLDGERFYATGVLLSGTCQAVAGLTLVASGDPLWAPIGMVVAVGAVLASGAGLFVAPGMMALFGGRSDREAPTAAPREPTTAEPRTPPRPAVERREPGPKAPDHAPKDDDAEDDEEDAP